jgi:His/Glu/Gln/Arg/opine family amino acid ABC transporter permease subunit
VIDLHGYGLSLLQGLQVTLLVGLCSLCVAMLMGLLGAWAKLARSKVANVVADLYTTVIRGVPELLLILLVYYGLTQLTQNLVRSLGTEFEGFRIDLDSFTAGVLTLGFIYGAFTTEVFRGAIQAVPKGQLEAASACGMSRTLLLRRVLLPQMLRFALPGLGNIWMVLIKATALMSVIQLPELLRKAEIAAGSTHLPFTFFFAVAAIFLFITAVSTVALKQAERWANRGVRR